MSTLTEFQLYDTAVLTSLVRGFRAAAGDTSAIVALISEAKGPVFPKAQDAYLRKTLARLVELQAPEIVVTNARRTIEPRALLLERLAEDGSVEEWELHSFAARGRRDIPDAYTTVEWLLDDDARREGPTPEMSEGWIAGFRARTPSVVAALFGDGPFLVDGIPTIGQDRAWVLDVAGAAATRRLCEALVKKAPPPLAEYRVWYPHLHAMAFTMDETREVPDDGPLAWEYARELTTAARVLESMMAMLRTCVSRKWCVQVAYE